MTWKVQFTHPDPEALNCRDVFLVPVDVDILGCQSPDSSLPCLGCSEPSESKILDCWMGREAANLLNEYKHMERLIFIEYDEAGKKVRIFRRTTSKDANQDFYFTE